MIIIVILIILKGPSRSFCQESCGLKRRSNQKALRERGASARRPPSSMATTSGGPSLIRGWELFVVTPRGVQPPPPFISVAL